MSDLFKKGDVIALLRGKTVLILGGSIQRGIYKDLIWLMNSNTLINKGVLGDKGETEFPDFESDRVSFKNEKESRKLQKIFHVKDRLHFCGSCEDDFKGLHSARNYTEVREYFNEEHNIMVIFKFINRISPTEQPNWTDSICSRLRRQRQLDIVFVNSGLWDVNRVGPLAHQDFRASLNVFTADISRSVQSVLCFWLTTPPISEETSGKGMTVPGLEQQNFLTRFDVNCVNKISSERFRDEVLQVIDIHYTLLSQTFYRNPDGIHWNPEANRMMTNKILTHLCLATNQNLPGRNNSPALERLKILSRGLDQRHTEEFERKLVTKHGDLRVKIKSVSRNFEEDCRKRVKKLWWNVRERGNFGFHLKDMSRRVVPRQGLKELELPPLEFIARTLPSPGEDERASEPNFGLSQTQLRPNSQSQSHPMHQPVEYFYESNRCQSQIGQTMPQEQPQVGQNFPHQEGLNNSTTQQVWGSNTNLQNHTNNNSNTQILNPAMVWAMEHNVRHPNHQFHDFSQVDDNGFPMAPAPMRGGHSNNGRRGRRGRIRSYSYEGGRHNPY